MSGRWRLRWLRITNGAGGCTAAAGVQVRAGLMTAKLQAGAVLMAVREPASAMLTATARHGCAVLVLTGSLALAGGMPVARAQSAASDGPVPAASAPSAPHTPLSQSAPAAEPSTPLRLTAADRAFDTQLAQLDRLGFNDPAGAAKALRALRADASQSATPVRRLLIDYTLGRMEAVSGSTDEAERVAQALERVPGGAALAHVVRAEVLDRIGQPLKAGELSRQALTTLEPPCTLKIGQGLPPECLWRPAYHALRLVELEQSSRGEHAFASATLRRALALAQAAQDAYASAAAMGELGLSSEQQGEGAAAQQWLAQAWQLAQGDPLSMVRVKMYEAMVANRRQDPRAQMAALEDALRLARQAGARREMSTLQNNLADAYIHAGEPAKAAAMARQALPLALAQGELRLERTLRHNLSVSLVLMRQFDAARHEIARVAELAQGDADPARRAVQLRELGEAYAQVGQWREALRLYHLERALSAETAQRNRESSLQQLRLKYDSEAKQRDLELLRRDRALKDQELQNRRLAQYVGVGLAVLMGLSLVLIVVMLARVREANRRLKMNQSLLRAQSERDPLTDLANRRHLLAVMEKQARDMFHGALLMIDIDHFKHVNDRYGHSAGDAVICEVARRISQAVRQDDLVVRWGGEEFLVFTKDVSADQLQLLAERILFTVGRTVIATPGGDLRVTCSIGFAHFPLPPAQLALHWEQAVNWADMALYTAKSQGRNRARGILTVDAGDAQALVQIEADFEAAVSAERVQLQTILGPDEVEKPAKPERPVP